MTNKVRVRFAPSPTGGLHLGGVRTVLFNYLFAKKHGGDFILRIEDTDQTRFVPGAEEYIIECLKWCGLTPDEGTEAGGEYGPYRQSERKDIYRKFANQLVSEGKAYYAFDTPEELEEKRAEIPNFQYGHSFRHQLRNSLTLPKDEVQRLLDEGTPYVIRINMPSNETISFTDLIRGFVSFDTTLVDDKVLLKADGMPTYHLAVVVDDFLMKITHAFRGEEWLPSAPVHLMLWKYLGWEDAMPQWAHLPLILKPDGNGKLSKRDGARLGFPVYAMNWADPSGGEVTPGFREMGFLPEAFINLLAMLGWNDGTDQEIFSIAELVEKFSLERVNHSGAKFDFEKAKWFNAEWIKKVNAEALQEDVLTLLTANNIKVSDSTKLVKIIGLVKDRCTLLTDFILQAGYFFKGPVSYDLDAVKPKWNVQKEDFFTVFISELEQLEHFATEEIEGLFKKLVADKGLKIGDVMLPFRVMLVGGKFGPAVFDIASLVGKEETISRIQKALEAFR
ncbi:glutamate--tRNA ligase [Desertivirga arenae]|uniref:glutamate--tRNA ligase n=1 Tax=Desertivirga arenae TaxID=2810309 RepID=UPI001A976FEB|nr:glutamate--tRNA ligase [Pedobacter sp. SYSU D00823]